MEEQAKYLFEVKPDPETRTVTILEGKAPIQPSIIPEPIAISGNIYAPAVFWEHRKHHFQLDRCHVEYSRHSRIIRLICDEKSEYNETVTGKLLMFEPLQALQINNFEHSYSRDSLIKTIKTYRPYFFNRKQADKIVNQLRLLKAKINTIIEKFDDQKGNQKDMVEKQLETNLDLGFVLQMPVFKGLEPVQIPVEVMLDYKGADEVVFYLESIELMDLMVDLTDEAMNTVLDSIECAKIEV